MSSESENQTVPIPQQEEASVLPNATIVCRTCNEVINDNETKLICKHAGCNSLFCNNCIKTMLNVMFAEPIFNYPLKCGHCSSSFDIEEVDRLAIEQNRYEQYISCVLPLFWSEDCLETNEKLVECPFCNYIEISTTDACPTYFLTCQNPSCSQRSCLVCLHAVKDEDEEKLHRDRCIEYHSYKEMVDTAIASGSQQQCPHCQLTGLKDDGCTHMTCGRCGLTWCYLCGKKEEECLVNEYEEPSLSAHNNEWEQHEGRCPQYLTSIQELDDRWPDNDRDCLEFFHRYRTLCQLYDVLKIIGEDKVNELNNNFGIIDASGYTIEEIKDYESRILINYSANGNS